MQGWWRTLAVGVATCWTTVLAAQSLDSNDRPFANAAVIVLGHDILAARCAEHSSIPADGVAKIETWVRENEVERIRERTRELEQIPDQRRQFSIVRRIFGSRFSVQGSAACKTAVDATQRDDAQFAKNSPAMIAALRTRYAAVASNAAPTSERTGVPTPGVPKTSNGAARPQPPTPVPTVGAAPPTGTTAPLPVTLAAQNDLAARIDRFGFDSRLGMGVGGFLTTNIFPVVLFKDGTALTEIEGLNFPGGLAAHRRANPDDWTRWRHQGDEWQLQSKGKWEKLAFRATYSTLPAGFHLTGHYSRLGGTGTVGVGGTASVTVVREYSFGADGQVVRGGAAGSSTRDGNASVVTSNVAPNRRGRYSIDGVTLRIRYDDGSQEQRIIVTDPADPKSVIWLDGDGFTRR